MSSSFPLCLLPSTPHQAGNGNKGSKLAFQISGLSFRKTKFLWILVKPVIWRLIQFTSIRHKSMRFHLIQINPRNLRESIMLEKVGERVTCTFHGLKGSSVFEEPIGQRAPGQVQKAKGFSWDQEDSGPGTAVHRPCFLKRCPKHLSLCWAGDTWRCQR